MFDAIADFFSDHSDIIKTVIVMVPVIAFGVAIVITHPGLF